MVTIKTQQNLVSIHPFVDGNGRTARLLMNLLLMQDGYPPAIIEPEKRAQYLEALALSDTTHHHDKFYEFIARAVEKSIDIYLEAAKKSIEE